MREVDATRRPHPGAEPVDTGPSDAATVRAIKGKGLVATITPHFAVAVIVGLVTAFATHKSDPVSESTGNEARRCNESVTQLRADFNQFKAEQAIHNLSNEAKLNELLARSWNTGLAQPSGQPSGLAAGVSRELGR